MSVIIAFLSWLSFLGNAGSFVIGHSLQGVVCQENKQVNVSAITQHLRSVLQYG